MCYSDVFTAYSFVWARRVEVEFLSNDTRGLLNLDAPYEESLAAIKF